MGPAPPRAHPSATTRVVARCRHIKRHVRVVDILMRTQCVLMSHERDFPPAIAFTDIDERCPADAARCFIYAACVLLRPLL